jgi:hypothetical protein
MREEQGRGGVGFASKRTHEGQQQQQQQQQQQAGGATYLE